MPLDEDHPVVVYHEATKHHSYRYARGPGYLDWGIQPSPFREYVGADVIRLQKVPAGELPRYDDVLDGKRPAPAPITAESISQLFYDSLAISAWKRAGGATWSLRVNPSSGNLHPTEGYLVCGPVRGLCESPVVCHYAPFEHVLEIRSQVPLALWAELTKDINSECVLVGLSSILWREAWKYGERAFRYCQHEIGHAIAAVSFAAAGLGWHASVLDDLGHDEIEALLGLFFEYEAEPEEPECLILVSRESEGLPYARLPTTVIEEFRGLEWAGVPNRLSRSHVDWGLEGIARETRKPGTSHLRSSVPRFRRQEQASRPLSLRQIIRTRRSAVEMDGTTSINGQAFSRMIARCLHREGCPPFDALQWPPTIQLAFMVHRVDGLEPGLYILVRDVQDEDRLRANLGGDYSWNRIVEFTEDLRFYMLERGDLRGIAREISCHQAIASDGCFCLIMLAAFDAALCSYGGWYYRRFFWEAGMIGQLLYLEADAARIRGTGIGCFFDDSVHDILGVTGRAYQDIYHFTAGGPVDDPRLTILPAYPE